jgi:hypothetical protein
MLIIKSLRLIIRAVNSYYFLLSKKFYTSAVTSLVDKLSSSIVSLSLRKGLFIVISD